jgi:hypothetical protein
VIGAINDQRLSAFSFACCERVRRFRVERVVSCDAGIDEMARLLNRTLFREGYFYHRTGLRRKDFCAVGGAPGIFQSATSTALRSRITKYLLACGAFVVSNQYSYLFPVVRGVGAAPFSG